MNIHIKYELMVEDKLFLSRSPLSPPPPSAVANVYCIVRVLSELYSFFLYCSISSQTNSVLIEAFRWQCLHVALARGNHSLATPGTLLYCTVLQTLCCTVLHYTVLCCTLLYYRHYIVLYCTTLYFPVLYCTTGTMSYCTALHCNLLYCTVLHALCCPVLHYTVLFFTE